MPDTLSKKNIAVTEISSTLANIWEELEKKNTTKACLFNLLIYEESSEPHTVLHGMLEEIIAQYPCRIISIYEDKGSKKKNIVASVSANLIGEGNNAVAHDRISLHVPTDLRMQAPFITLPLFLPDLPIYLLWAQNPSHDNDVFPQLKQLANHIIFDSSCVKGIAPYCDFILRELKNFSGGISDLNWAVLEPWRIILRRCFNSPARIQQLASAKTIRIQYNSLGKSDYNDQLPALFLQAWLASCMNWSFENCDNYEGNTHLSYQHLTGNVSLLLVPENNKKLPRGAITSLSLNSRDKHTYLCKQEEDKPFVTVHISSPEKCEFPSQHHNDPLNVQHLLVKRVLQNFTSNHYVKTLRTLAQMDS